MANLLQRHVHAVHLPEDETPQVAVVGALRAHDQILVRTDEPIDRVTHQHEPHHGRFGVPGRVPPDLLDVCPRWHGIVHTRQCLQVTRRVRQLLVRHAGPPIELIHPGRRRHLADRTPEQSESWLQEVVVERLLLLLLLLLPTLRRNV
uniref:Uncharacterized protein n=1 Tax=Anopheles atroparvus TaxID=41427 RepID=A0A182J046_ANOAO